MKIFLGLILIILIIVNIYIKEYLIDFDIYISKTLYNCYFVDTLKFIKDSFNLGIFEIYLLGMLFFNKNKIKVCYY